MVFRDRCHAGLCLANELNAYRGDPTAVVLALPRGGVVVGYEISRALHLPLDVFITRKLSTPDNPEYAIGAVSETGALYLNPEAVEVFHLSHDDLEGLIEVQRQEIARRQALYRQGRGVATRTPSWNFQRTRTRYRLPVDCRASRSSKP